MLDVLLLVAGAASALPPGAPAPPVPAAKSGGGVLPSVTARFSASGVRRPADLPPDAELVAAGARVGRIHVHTEPIFDTSRPEENTSLFRLANRLHIETRPATIESQLLFASGETYDPRLLEETARILRSTRYLHEAQVVPVAFHDGLVDVAVVTQDVWTLNPGVSFGRSGGENSGGVEIEELNLLGRGTTLSLGFTSDVDRDSTKFRYADRQIGDSWWSTELEYADNSDGRRADVSLDHPFYSLDTRRAGGLFLLDDDRVDSRYDLGEITEKYRTRQRRATAYAGRSAGLVDARAIRWTTGFTYEDNRFDRADDPLATANVPPDRRLAYPWIGLEWVQDDFRTVRNRDLIERTEDVALGWRAGAWLGFADAAFGADRTAAIFDARVGRGHEPSTRDTWLYAGSLSGRYEHGELTNTVLSGSARYYRRQSARRVFFASVAFDASHNLDPDRQLLLGGDNGLRGYPLRYQAGEGRWLATIEQRGFTNWFPFRLFNVGGAAFVDVGGTWGDNPYGTESQGVLKDIGVGLRLGNARSALGNVLHIDFAFPLDGDPSIDTLQIVIETKQTF